MNGMKSINVHFNRIVRIIVVKYVSCTCVQKHDIDENLALLWGELLVAKAKPKLLSPEKEKMYVENKELLVN